LLFIVDSDSLKQSLKFNKVPSMEMLGCLGRWDSNTGGSYVYGLWGRVFRPNSL